MNHAKSNSSPPPGHEHVPGEPGHPPHSHRDTAGARRRRRLRTYGVTAAVILTATTASAGYLATAEPGADSSPAAPPRAHGGTVDFTVRGGTASVDTGSLRVTGRTDSGAVLPVSGAAEQSLGKPGKVTVEGGTARWTYPEKHLTVSAASERGRLRMTVRSAADQNLSWPSTGGAAAGTGSGTATASGAGGALQIPRGEGLSVPVTDHFWNSEDAGLKGSEADLTGGLTLPLWGYTQGKHGVSYLVPEGVGTSLGFASKGGRLSATAQHEFSRREQTRDYTVDFSLTGSSPVAAATDYRNWLDEHGRTRTLKEKIAENPANERLLGAMHAYAWGGARSEKAVNELRKQGVSRLWLGYDSDYQPMSKQAVSAAKKNGYLVGPYDSYDNGQPAKSADNPSSKWPGTVYPDFCVRNWKGEVKEGFGGRGCYMSSEAFKKAEPDKHYLADRAKKMTANGADSYFLDVDAAGELFTDSTKGHRMNKKQDRANRLERMRTLASKNKLVLGSESAASWAAPVLAFNHGAQTPVTDGLWKFQKDKKKWGGYAPQKAPKFFFQPTKLPASLAKAMYDPQYRIPMYETALHGSVINTDRWEMPYDKFPAQKTDRALMAMLYNTPLNFVLGDANLKSAGKEMAALQRYFAPLHKAAGTEKMTGFERLTGDNQVQRSVFGDGKLTVTANFGKKKHGSLPGGCVDAKLHNEQQAHRLCPAS